MDNERMTWKGMRVEKLEKSKKIETSISGLRHSIRTELNPHKPILDINHELLTQQAFELADKMIQLKQFSKEIAALNRSLGIE